jgi:hypothetical protein
LDLKIIDIRFITLIARGRSLRDVLCSNHMAFPTRALTDHVVDGPGRSLTKSTAGESAF